MCMYLGLTSCFPLPCVGILSPDKSVYVVDLMSGSRDLEWLTMIQDASMEPPLSPLSPSVFKERDPNMSSNWS